MPEGNSASECLARRRQDLICRDSPFIDPHGARAIPATEAAIPGTGESGARRIDEASAAVILMAVIRAQTFGPVGSVLPVGPQTA